MIDIYTFSAMVARMRYLQVEATKFKSSSARLACAKAEKEVDTALQSMLQPPKGTQFEMF